MGNKKREVGGRRQEVEWSAKHPPRGTNETILSTLMQSSNRNEENETNTVISTEGEPEANRREEI